MARWITWDHLHLDRVATPWLIRRFIDPNAEFEFVAWGSPLPDQNGETVIFGIPEAGELSSHDEDGTTFSKVLRKYEIEDPALERMQRIVAAGVMHAHGKSVDEDGYDDDEAAMGAALDLIGAGLGVAFQDRDHLERAMALYEAVYVACQMKSLPPEVLQDLPGNLPERVPYLRRALGRHV